MTPLWYETVLLSVDDSRWIQSFRLPCHVVESLCEKLKDDMAPADCTVREPIPLKKRFVIGVKSLVHSHFNYYLMHV